MTITGGPGWVADTAGRSEPDVSGEEAARPRLRQALALGLAVVVGAGASQALSDERRSALVDTPEGRLSLALGGAGGPDYVTDEDGRLAVALSLVVRNTGPADVVLESATVGGLADDAVAGRSVPAEGTTRVALVRAVDCAELPPDTVRLGPLVVRARTPAGTKEERLPLEGDPGERFAERLRAACGQVPPEDALDLEAAVLQLEGDAARLPLLLGNTSARDVVVTAVRSSPGLQVELLDDGGARVALPLRLPATDLAVPRPPGAVARERAGLVAVLRLDGCAVPPDPARPLLELSVGARPDGATATFGYGDADRVLRRLIESGCPTGTTAAG